MAIGIYLWAEGVETTGDLGIFLAPLGVEPESLYMPDYRPLLPWFGVMLLGLFFGNVLYGWRSAGPGDAYGPPGAALLAFLGRHTLLVYLFHQPVLIAALWVVGSIEPGF